MLIVLSDVSLSEADRAFRSNNRDGDELLSALDSSYCS